MSPMLGMFCLSLPVLPGPGKPSPIAFASERFLPVGDTCIPKKSLCCVCQARPWLSSGHPPSSEITASGRQPTAVGEKIGAGGQREVRLPHTPWPLSSPTSLQRITSQISLIYPFGRCHLSPVGRCPVNVHHLLDQHSRSSS